MQRFQKLQVSIALVAALAAMQAATALPVLFATGLCGDGLSFDLTVTNAVVERVDFGPGAAGGAKLQTCLGSNQKVVLGRR